MDGYRPHKKQCITFENIKEQDAVPRLLATEDFLCKKDNSLRTF